MSKSSRRRPGPDFNDRHPFTETKRVLHDLGRDDLIHDPVRDPRNDNRLFHPDRERKILPVTKTLVGLKVANRDRRNNSIKRGSQGPNRYDHPVGTGVDYLNPTHWITAPRQTLVCARRAIRRSVILSKLLKRGRGKGGGGKPRDKKYNNDSLIHCRR